MEDSMDDSTKVIVPNTMDLPHNIKQSLLEKLEYSVYSIDKKDIVARQILQEAIYTIGR